MTRRTSGTTFNGYEAPVVRRHARRGTLHRLGFFPASGASATVTGTDDAAPAPRHHLSAFDDESVKLARHVSIDHLVGIIGHIEALVLAVSWNLPHGACRPTSRPSSSRPPAPHCSAPRSWIHPASPSSSGQSPAPAAGRVVNTGAVTSSLQLGAAPSRRSSASRPSRRRGAGWNWARPWCAARTPCSRRSARPASASTRRAPRRSGGSRVRPRRQNGSAASPGSVTPLKFDAALSLAQQRRRAHHLGAPSASADHGPARVPRRRGDFSESSRSRSRVDGHISPILKSVWHPEGRRRRVGRSLVPLGRTSLYRERFSRAPPRAGRTWIGRVRGEAASRSRSSCRGRTRRSEARGPPSSRRSGRLEAPRLRGPRRRAATRWRSTAWPGGRRTGGAREQGGLRGRHPGRA